MFHREKGSEIKASIMLSSTTDDPAVVLKKAVTDAFIKLTDQEREDFARRATLQAKATPAKKNEQAAGTIFSKVASSATPTAAGRKVASWMSRSTPSSAEAASGGKSIKENQDNAPGNGQGLVLNAPRVFTSIKDSLQSSLQPAAKGKGKGGDKKRDSPTAKGGAGAGKPPVPASKPAAASSSKAVAPAGPKNKFFMTPAEREAKDRREREEQAALKARKREQELIEMRERRKREDSKAFVSTGGGSHQFFSIAKESISASAEARLIRRDRYVRALCAGM